MRSIKKRRRFAFLLAGVIGLTALAAMACSESTQTTTPGQPTATTSSQAPTSTVGPQGTTTAPAGEGQAIITVGHHDSLGDILVNNAGMTLYLFTRDEPGVSNCSGGCAATWPPVTTAGAPMFEITSAQLGTITRGDGTTQVTVNGLPVYTYVGDNARGDTNGQGIGDQWYVMDAGGNAVTSDPSVGNGGGDTEGTAATIQGFNLPNLQITSGTTVTWTNQDGVPHTVTHGTPSAQGDGFGSNSLDQGGTFSHTFDEAGRFDYFCQIHPSMTGVIVVTVGGPDTSTPTATPTPAAAPATATATPVPATSTPAATATLVPTATPDDGLGEQYSAEIRFFVHEVFEVPVGTTVTWTNGDNAGHTVTSGTVSGGNSGGPLSSSTMVRNDTYSFTFSEPGEYQYYCIFPHNMQGKVTVVAAE